MRTDSPLRGTPGRAAAMAAIAVAALLSLASASPARAITAAELGSGLSSLMAGAGGASGGFVMDAETDATLFARAENTRRALASNTKLFATSTALVKFGPDGRLETTVYQAGAVSGGVLTGSLVLRGDGDPLLSARDLAVLAGRVRAAGITQVTGRLVYDESAWDRKRSVPQSGVRRESLGPALSGLIFAGGAKRAAQRFVAALRKRGVVMPKKVKPGRLPVGSTELSAMESDPVSDLIRLTNVYSNNFLAEALLKAVGAHFGGGGSTAAGVSAMTEFAAARNAPMSAQNGSGLSTKDRSTPRAVAELLDSMLDEPEATANAWTGSLAVAGRTGTLARRMRGTAADGRCRAKTGTLRGVSALSGYCFTGTEATVFSFLFNRVNTYRTKKLEDKLTALVARYDG